jgi:hypothetical protein
MNSNDRTDYCDICKVWYCDFRNLKRDKIPVPRSKPIPIPKKKDKSINRWAVLY